MICFLGDGARKKEVPAYRSRDHGLAPLYPFWEVLVPTIQLQNIRFSDDYIIFFTSLSRSLLEGKTYYYVYIHTALIIYFSEPKTECMFVRCYRSAAPLLYHDENNFDLT
jgi:hypothetical protein